MVEVALENDLVRCPCFVPGHCRAGRATASAKAQIPPFLSPLHAFPKRLPSSAHHSLFFLNKPPGLFLPGQRRTYLVAIIFRYPGVLLLHPAFPTLLLIPRFQQGNHSLPWP